MEHEATVGLIFCAFLTATVSTQAEETADLNNPLNAGNALVPLLVQDVDSAGRNPFAVNASCPNPGRCVAVATLPATTANGGPAKTVVIEFVSAVCNGLALGITQDVFTFFYDLGGQRHWAFFPAAVEAGIGKMALQTVVYADPGSFTQLGTPGNNSGCAISVSGHLIPQVVGAGQSRH